MEPIYKHTQRGSVMMAILILSVLGLTVLAVQATQSGAPVLLLATLFLVLAVTILTFSSLTVSVDAQQVRIAFGPGMLRRSFPVADITGVGVVRNAVWMGLGIHFFPGGLIYNVSGLDGVEIIFKNGRKVRIGTDEPAVLARAIEGVIVRQ